MKPSSDELAKGDMMNVMDDTAANEIVACRVCGGDVQAIVIDETHSFQPTVCPDCYEREAAKRQESDRSQARENRMRGMGLRPLWWSLGFGDFTAVIDLPVRDDCVKYAKGWPQTSGLVLYSQSAGTGKSMLAACILKSVGKGWWANAAELLEAIRRSFDNGPPAAIYTKSFDTPLLVIDDLGAHKVTDWTQEMFYSLLNYRIEELLPTIITTNVKDISRVFGERVASRVFGHCDVLTLKGKDFRRDGHATRT